MARPGAPRRTRGLTLVRLRRSLGEDAVGFLDDPAWSGHPDLAEMLERERMRLQSMFVHEDALRAQGCRLVAGVDEVGRGPLAGPVVAAAVVFDAQPWIPLLNDSKALSPQEREILVPLIKARAVAWSVAQVDVEEFTQFNMHQASLEAMRRAIAGLSVAPDAVLVDGCHCVPTLTCPQMSLVKGDGASLSIAAASVVAKVSRDHYMERMDAVYPCYGFQANKGYGTAEHLAALRRVGPSPIHRPTFAPVAAAGCPRDVSTGTAGAAAGHSRDYSTGAAGTATGCPRDASEGAPAAAGRDCQLELF